MQTSTPRRLSIEIRRLSQRVSPGAELSFVPVRASTTAVQNECFGNVQNQVRQFGGEIVCGWTLWEWPSVMIEAEFHAVWRSPTGGLVDVSPRSNGEEQILFVPDPRRTFEGQQINNVRVALQDNSLIDEFIDLANELFAVLNAGERAEQFGLVSVPAAEVRGVLLRQREIQKALTMRYMGRNSSCHCGSGRKFKKCCGK